MNRRDLILLGGAAVYWPLTARAQQKSMPVIGYLSTDSASPGPNAPYVVAFRQGLTEASYVEGQNVAIEFRWAEGSYERLLALAADLVARRVDVIATHGTPGIQAAQNASSTIPIVFVGGFDPVTTGLVGSLARPGGNLTGFSLTSREVIETAGIPV